MSTTIFTLYWHASDETYPIPLDEFRTDHVADGDAYFEIWCLIDDINAGEDSCDGVWSIGIRYE